MIKAPLDNNQIVFNNGIDKGSNGVIPIGGQDPPISIAGERLEWKKAQINIISSSAPYSTFGCARQAGGREENQIKGRQCKHADIL